MYLERSSDELGRNVSEKPSEKCPHSDRLLQTCTCTINAIDQSLVLEGEGLWAVTRFDALLAQLSFISQTLCTARCVLSSVADY